MTALPICLCGGAGARPGGPAMLMEMRRRLGDPADRTFAGLRMSGDCRDGTTAARGCRLGAVCNDAVQTRTKQP